MRGVLVSVCAGFAAVCAPVALGGSATTKAKDAFSGQISASSGRFSADTGNVAIDLAPGSSAQTPRKLTIAFHRRGCGRKRHCVHLSGTLTGRLTVNFPRIPDVGQSFTIHASGRLKPLGHVSAQGLVNGTGFIARGRETLHLRLHTRRGTISVRAQSGLVPGFTSP